MNMGRLSPRIAAISQYTERFIVVQAMVELWQRLSSIAVSDVKEGEDESKEEDVIQRVQRYRYQRIQCYLVT